MTEPILSRYSGRCVLAIGAHPDDVEMGMGGTVARLVQLGARVVFAIGCVPCRFEQRMREARQAAEMLGAGVQLIFDHGASHVEDRPSYDLVGRLDRLVRELKPAAIFAHGRAEIHRDHQLMFDAFRATLRLGGMDGYCYQPCACRPTPLVFQPQAFVEIGSTLEQKMKAVAAHRSQFEERGLDIGFLKEIAGYYGCQAGLTYAEGLEVIQLRLA